MSHGILLVNLGTPDSPLTRDVRRYLDEFLMDGRVIGIHPLTRALLVKGIIVPFRGPKSAQTYRQIWTDRGSPLLLHSVRLKELLQERLGDDSVVELAMRYQHPGIPEVLEKMRRLQLSSLTVVPLFPQYASATVGSVHQKVMNSLKSWETIPEIRLVSQFYDHPKVVRAFAERGRSHDPDRFDHILFSFHGIPQRQLLKADDSGQHCLQSADCCRSLTPRNHLCYSAQCYAMARLIADELGLAEDQYTVTFQSRLGRDPWTQPYTSEVIQALGREGAKQLLVFSPAFVGDCLETLYEITLENNHLFREAGGEAIELVESLNDHPMWVEALADIATSQNPTRCE